MARAHWLIAVAVGTAAVFGLPPTPARAATVTIGENQEVLVDGEPFLPIMQWLQSSSRIAHQSTLGINTFVGNGGQNSSQEYLDECAAHGVWGVMNPGDLSVASHGSLLGWIFGDEPDLESHQTEPSEVLAEYQTIKAADPNHPTFLTVTARFYSEFDPPPWMNGSRDRYTEYAQATDIIGFDLYPIYGWCQPDWLYMTGASHEELVTLYAPNQPTYQWIECARTSSQWCELDERGEDDGPYPEEVRNEVWQAIAHGATAIGYFTHSWECPGYTQFCLTAEQEAELIRTNGQLTALAAPILSPRYAEVVTVTTSPEAQVDWIAKAYQDQVYLFAVNVDRASTEATFTVPGMAADAEVTVVDESRTVQASGESFTDGFDELGVHIYAIAVTGSSGTGGGGTGGGSSSSSGSGGAGGSSSGATPTSGEDDGGCGCRLAGSPAPSLALLGAFVGLALAATRRRHR